MTTTTETCQRPCFCSNCWVTTIDDLITERSELLQGAIADQLYEPGFEARLAEELIWAIPVAGRIDVLEYMLTWEHLMPRVMAVDCLLDETSTRSYDALQAMGRILLEAIRAQGSEGSALQTLIVNEICDPIRLQVRRGVSGRKSKAAR